MSCRVSVAACGDYSEESIRAAFDAALEPMGGLDWIEPGMRIAVKVNLVSLMRPETAAVTHPALVRELTRRISQRGAEAIVGDSPGGPWSAAWVNGVYAAAGFKAVEGAGGRLNRDFSLREAAFPEAKIIKTFPYTAWLDGADFVIDFCKLKTHGLMGMTCAVKNLFGVVPGTRKPEFHYLYKGISDFAHMLVDLNEYVKPRLTLVDAVDCMEGNGPTQGKPRHMGALIAARTPYDADLLCAKLIGFEPTDIPTVRAAAERGLCPASPDELDIAGDYAPFVMPDFDRLPLPEDTAFKQKLAIVDRFFEISFRSRPQVVRAECVGCGKCAEVCPRKTIRMDGGKAVIDRKDCIRCFCCQEFCPKGAMVVRRPLVARAVGRKTRLGK